MYHRQFVILVFSALVQFFVQVYGDETACLEVKVTRNTHYYTPSPGESISVYCPVKYCPDRQPNMTWCKLYGDGCVPLQEEPNTITTKWEQNKSTANSGDFILNFLSVQPNHTGFYRCEVGYLGGQKILSHNIVVNVTVGYGTEPANNTVPPNYSAMKNLPWQVYAFIPLGILCLLITTCTLLYIGLQRNTEKHKKSQDTPQPGTNMISSAVSSHPIGISTSTQNVQDSVDYSSLFGLPQGTRDETIYENDALPSWIHNPTGPAPKNIQSACNLNISLADNEDVIVYAALNHSLNESKAFQEGPAAELELTEYAAICVRN